MNFVSKWGKISHRKFIMNNEVLVMLQINKLIIYRKIVEKNITKFLRKLAFKG